ncbi:MAG: hypothetical protein A2494_04360 [Candidatus Lloydbacteria bacterium RIFOXYC12_FULL_46_25]|uniref:Uncharacterized protein n=1 Tax=Candidatus Lloydbacteria bacterium RIFOXYC12_FULL_46_25 TaxID=1798670 RepID=A0A1G2DRN9_9BACT|nr:MAG: hypothetical protein A2494_04360 [Candidatus Lloydbacteria bacterium RIFOXYC12_FULL_46_25]
MGHYASEMEHEDAKTKRLRLRYHRVRKELSGTPATKFSLGELREALDLLSEKNTPRSFKNSVFAEEVIKKMRRLLRKAKARKKFYSIEEMNKGKK